MSTQLRQKGHSWPMLLKHWAPGGNSIPPPFLSVLFDSQEQEMRGNTTKKSLRKKRVGVSSEQLLPWSSSSKQVTHSQGEVIFAAFWFILQKQWSIIRAAQAFRNVLVHRGSFWNLKVLNARGLPLTGRKPVMETSLLRCKGHNNRGKILCQHIYFQSRGFNQGKWSSQDNLEHITPSKEACTFASITKINISNKKNALPWMPPHKGSRQGSVVNFWRSYSDSNHRGQIVFHGHLEFISSFCWGFETYYWNAHLWNFPWYQEVIPSQRIWVIACVCDLIDFQVRVWMGH